MIAEVELTVETGEGGANQGNVWEKAPKVWVRVRLRFGIVVRFGMTALSHTLSLSLSHSLSLFFSHT
jgi:hypothetical protein